MARTKTPHTNTVGAMVAAAAAAASPIIPVPEMISLNARERAFWPAIVRTRARSEWTEIDLIHAADLARCLAALQEEIGHLQREGSVIAGANSEIANPRVRVISALRAQSLALTRILHMQSAFATNPEDVQRKRAAERKAREVARGLEESDSDSLIKRRPIFSGESS